VIAKLNLASHPFRNRTTPYLLSMLLLALAVSGGLLCFAQITNNNTQADLARSQSRQMEEEVNRLKGEGAKIQQQLTPEQQALLIASHKLVDNKSFGWSRLFADLESVLPSNVSASRIAVQNIFKDGDRVKAELEFGVISRDYQAVMAMIGTMNNSGLFQAELRGQDLQKNERTCFTEYTLRLIYTPAYGYTAAPSSDVARNGQGGAQQ